MSKNIIIGALVLAVVVGGGYALLKDKPTEDVTDNTSTNTPEYTTPAETYTTPAVVTSGAPTVTTSANAGVSSSTATVTGEVKPNGASTTYWFEYGETTALGSRTSSQNIGSSFSKIPTPAFITGLKADTKYYFRLSANNRFSTLNGITYTFQTNNNPPQQGTTPTSRTLSATDISRTTANLEGQVNPRGSETRYWFEYGKDVNLGNVTSLETLASGNTTVAVASPVSNLEPLTKYYFRLNAQNQFGTVNGAILNFTTKGPATPSSPSVTTTGASNIKSDSAALNGRINPNGAETTYWFEYSSDSLLSILIGSGTPREVLAAGTDNVNVSADIENLSKNTKYYYRLIGRNSFGVVRGSILSFTTKD